MLERRRVDAQPAFVLHSYPHRETSLILDVFSRDFGRVSLMARGARRPRSALRGVLMAFQPLEIAWAGSGEVMTLMKAEWQGGLPLLTDKALFVAYYYNELLIHLLPREDAHERLYAAYFQALYSLSEGLVEGHIRSFEKFLLQELGYGLTLEMDIYGCPILYDQLYQYQPEKGAVPIHNIDFVTCPILGKSLLDFSQDDFSDSITAQQIKQLMRQLLHYHLGGRLLTTRKIFQELQDL